LICDDEKLPGIIPEMANKIFAAQGYKIQIKLLASLSRAVKEVESGNYDGLIAGNKTLAPNLIYPKNSVLPHSSQFFSHASLNWKYRGTDSLKNIQLGAVKGFDYASKSLNKYIELGKRVSEIDQNHSAERIIKMIELRRIDTWIAGNYVAKYHINKLGLSKLIVPSSKIIGTYHNYISFSPKNLNAQKYADIVDLGMKKFYNNKNMKKLLLKYGIY
jgi:ABC-type amino acid transport substrate-binding protein